jgi:L-lactate dehydrogenase complex protein LldF
MPDAFHQHIRASLAQEHLQRALDANTERRRNARVQAFASLPAELHSMRQRAHAARADIIANLEQYLEQFTAHLQAHGVTVHHAADAAQAVQIVLEIARQSQARLIAKSKTMVGEEIEINQALEAAGIQPVETDLGEYIVQLRHERPAHIITPAVHLTRADVGQLFHEKLGLPYTEDVPALTAAARGVLRQTFLSAEVGLSGVNFGVAQEGAMVVLTNEGNGRMVTTLPPVHIALMGIERLLRDMDDLALMLALLPRSATGQKLTVYTSVLYGPRRPGDPDGPQARHLVLLDNGRRRLSSSPLAEALYCIRCGACLNVCPVFRELGGHAYVGKHGQPTPYPGPIGAVISPGLLGQAEFGNLARASSLCGACREACPVDIDLPGLLLRVRAGGAGSAATISAPAASAPAASGTPSPSVPPQPALTHAPGGLRLGLRLYAWTATSPGRFALAQRLAGTFSRFIMPASAWLRLPAFTGWGLSRDFPKPAAKPFRQRWQALQAAQPQASVGLSSSIQGNIEQAPSGSAAQELVQPAVIPGDPQARFQSELEALGGRFIACTQADLAEQVAAFLQAKGVRLLLSWEAQELPPGLLAALSAAGISLCHTPQQARQPHPQHSAAAPDLPPATAGLTGALAGIAETGSLLLTGGAGRPLTASLLPELHLALLPAAAIYPTLAQALHSPLLGGDACAAAVLVSGPSRTADIEMTLTIGVHGPGELVVFCYA